MSSTGYPIVLDLAGRSCLVVGGGHIALRKITSLLDAGAVVTVVAPEVVGEIETLAVKVLRREYSAGDLEGCRVAVAATGNPAVDGAVYADGERLGVLVNSADDPAHCAFTLPAVVRRGAVSVAVATDGTSPALSTWLRDRISASLPEHLETLTDLVAGARDAILRAGVGTEGLEWHHLIDELDAAVRHAPDRAERTVDAFVTAAIARPGGPSVALGGTVKS